MSKLDRIERLALAVVATMVVIILLGAYMVQTMSPGTTIPLCEKGCQQVELEPLWPMML